MEADPLTLGWWDIVVAGELALLPEASFELDLGAEVLFVVDRPSSEPESLLSSLVFSRRRSDRAAADFERLW